MKANWIYPLLLLLLTTGSCKKNDATDDNSPVNPEDRNKLQSVINIPNGQLTAGNPPSPTGGSQSPVLSLSQSSAAINPGGQLILPFQYSSPGGYAVVYLQVDGATNGFIRVNSPSGNGSGIIGLPVFIPSRVLKGSFCVSYCIQDNQGRVSNIINTCVTIKDALNCSNANASGSEGLTFTNITMGNNAGTARLNFDTYTVPDRIDIYQGNNWLAGTGTNPNSIVPPLSNCSGVLPGFVGRSDVLSFNYNPANGKTITVVVSGCLGGGTAWEWDLVCP